MRQSFALMLWIEVPRSLFPPIPTSPLAPHLQFIIALFLPTLFKMSCLQFLDLQEICTGVAGLLIEFPLLAQQETCETHGLSKVTWHLSCTLCFYFVHLASVTILYSLLILQVLSIVVRTGYFKLQEIINYVSER